METAAPPDTVRFTTVRSRSASGNVLVSWTGLADCVEAHVVRNRSDAAAAQMAGAPSDRGAALWWLTAGRLATSGLPAPVGRGFLVLACLSSSCSRSCRARIPGLACLSSSCSWGDCCTRTSSTVMFFNCITRAPRPAGGPRPPRLQPPGARRRPFPPPTPKGMGHGATSGGSSAGGRGCSRKKGPRLLVGTARPICVVDADGSGADPGNHHIDLSADPRMATVS